MSRTDPNTIVMYAGFGAAVQCFGLHNVFGAAAFTSVALYSAWQRKHHSPNDYSPLLLAGAAAIFTGENVIDTAIKAKDGYNIEFWRAASLAFGGVGGIIGDITLRAKQDFNSAVGGIKGATLATIRNPAFWYSFCALGIGTSALLAKPGIATAALILASMACCVKSLTISTQRLMMAGRGEIPESQVNNGQSNLWSARSLPFLAATFLIGATNDPMLLISTAGSCILAYKEMLLTRAFDPTSRFTDILRKPSLKIS